MLEQFNHIIIQIANFLSTPLFSESIFDLDLWHLVHFVAGVLIFLIILKLFKKQKIHIKFIILFAIIFLYEIFEWTFYRNSHDIFRPESLMNVFGDLSFALIGGYLSKFNNSE